MNKGEFVFVVEHSGERGAGILPFSDTITIQVASGDLGGDDGEFEEFMRGTLKEWYDGAAVYTDKEYQGMLQADHDSYCFGSGE
jgi:hypothetical protein